MIRHYKEQLHGKLLSIYFFDDNFLNATITLPADPLDPRFEISLLNPGWDYFYADPTFYDARPNKPGSNYLQGSAAFEKYNDKNQALELIDSTSFESLTRIMRGKNWDLADCIVIFYVEEVEQPPFIINGMPGI